MRRFGLTGGSFPERTPLASPSTALSRFYRPETSTEWGSQLHVKLQHYYHLMIGPVEIRLRIRISDIADGSGGAGDEMTMWLFEREPETFVD